MPYNADSLLKFAQPGGKPQADPMAAMKMMGMFTDYLKRYKPPAGSDSLVANSTGNIPASQTASILSEGGFTSALGGDDGVMGGMLSSLAGSAGSDAMATAGGTLASGAADGAMGSAISGTAGAALADVASWW